MSHHHGRKKDAVQHDARIAVVGTGAVGSAVATILMEHGYPVRVWNRRRSAAHALVRRGAVQTSPVQAAVSDCDLVLICLTDYAAVREVLAPVSAGEANEPTTLVTLTTGTPGDARSMRDHLAARGMLHVDAGVQSAPEDVGTERATFLYSGSASGFSAHRSVLETLGAATWLGEEVTAAATWDLALFGLWYDAQLGLLRAFDMLPDTPEARESFAPAASRQLAHVVDATGATAAELGQRDYPRGPASLDEHIVVLRQLREARARNRLGDGGLTAPQRLVEAFQGAGHGALGLTALADRGLDPS